MITGKNSNRRKPGAVDKTSAGNAPLRGTLFVMAFLIVFLFTFFINPTCASARDETMLDQVRKLVWDDQLDSAEKLLKHYIKNNPDDPEAQYELGCLYFRTNRYEDSLTALNKAVELSPGNSAYREMLARTYLKSGDSAKALEVYNSMLERGEKSSYVYRRLAWIYFLNQDYEKAKDRLNDALMKNPYDSETYILLAQVLQARGQNWEAIDCYRKLLAINHGNRQILYSLAGLYQEAGDYEKAIEIYRQITNRYPGESEAYRELAALYRMQGDVFQSIGAWVAFQLSGIPISSATFLLIFTIFFLLTLPYTIRAISALVLLPAILILGGVKQVTLLEILGRIVPKYSFDALAYLCYYEIVMIDPLNGKAWYRMGTYHEKKDQKERAVECYLKAVRYDSGLYEAWYALGVIYNKDKRYKEAELALKKSLDRNDDYFMSWYYLGMSLYEQGNYEDAVSAARHSLKLNNNFIPALDLLVEAGESSGSLDDAGEILEDLIRKNPNNSKYQIEMGNLLLTMGRAGESLQYFEKSIELIPESYEAWYNYGVAQREAGLLENASVSIEKAVELAPESSWIYASFGLTCMMKKQRARAERILRKSLELDPLSAYSHYLLGVLLKDSDSSRARTHLEKAIEYFQKEVDKLNKPWHKANEFECIGIALQDAGQEEKAGQAFQSAIKYAQITPKNIYIFSEERLKLTEREEFMKECKSKLEEIKKKAGEEGNG